MMRLLYWATIAVLFLTLPLAARAESSKDLTLPTDPTEREYGIGLLLNAEGTGPFLKAEEKIPVYPEPDDHVKQSGTLKAGSALNQESYYNYFYLDPNPPAPTFMQKLTGNIPQPVLFHAVPDLLVEENVNGIVIYDTVGKYMKTSVGWLWKDKSFDEKGALFTWEKIVAETKTFPSYSPPEKVFSRWKKKEERSLSKLTDMRAKADFMPVGIVELFTSPSAETSHISVEKPIEFAILDQNDDWYRVMLVLNECRHSKGIKDYREGTIAWVPLMRDNGVPNFKRSDQSCD